MHIFPVPSRSGCKRNSSELVDNDKRNSNIKPRRTVAKAGRCRTTPAISPMSNDCCDFLDNHVMRSPCRLCCPCTERLANAMVIVLNLCIESNRVKWGERERDRHTDCAIRDIVSTLCFGFTVVRRRKTRCTNFGEYWACALSQSSDTTKYDPVSFMSLLSVSRKLQLCIFIHN